jgi:hypothetical protein
VDFGVRGNQYKLAFYVVILDEDVSDGQILMIDMIAPTLSNMQTISRSLIALLTQIRIRMFMQTLSPTVNCTSTMTLGSRLWSP